MKDLKLYIRSFGTKDEINNLVNNLNSFFHEGKQSGNLVLGFDSTAIKTNSDIKVKIIDINEYLKKEDPWPLTTEELEGYKASNPEITKLYTCTYYAQLRYNYGFELLGLSKQEINNKIDYSKEENERLVYNQLCSYFLGHNLRGHIGMKNKDINFEIVHIEFMNNQMGPVEKLSTNDILGDFFSYFIPYEEYSAFHMHLKGLHDFDEKDLEEMEKIAHNMADDELESAIANFLKSYIVKWCHYLDCPD